MRDFILRNSIAIKIRLEKGAEAVKEKLTEKNGSFLEEVIKYAIYFVIGALLLAGIYALFKNIILPKITDSTEKMFNYSA